MVEKIMGIYVAFLEVCCLKKFLEIFGECRKGKDRVHWIIKLFAAAVMVWVIADLLKNVMLIKVAVLIAAESVLFKIWMHFSVQQAVWYITVFQGMLFVDDYITFALYPAITDPKLSPEREFFVLTFGKIVLFLVILGIGKYIRKNVHEVLSRADKIRMLFIPVFMVCFVWAVSSRIDYIIHGKLQNVIVVLAVGMTGSIALMFYFMQELVKKEHAIHKTQLANLQAENQLQFYESMTENIELQRKKMHEYKNQMECMQILMRDKKYQELEQYLEQIGGELLGKFDRINTHHSVINAVVNAKYQEACRKNVVMVLQLNDLSKVWLTTKDIVILLANLLDNAIEACEMCVEKDRRIELKFVCEPGQVVLGIRNTYQPEKLRKEKNEFITTKETEQENHGIGIKNVIEVIEKYHGTYIISPEKEMFGVFIMIPEEGSNTNDAF